MLNLQPVVLAALLLVACPAASEAVPASDASSPLSRNFPSHRHRRSSHPSQSGVGRFERELVRLENRLEARLENAELELKLDRIESLEKKIENQFASLSESNNKLKPSDGAAFDSADCPTWDENVEYHPGSCVIYKGRTYTSLVDQVDWSIPDFTPTLWQPCDKPPAPAPTPTIPTRTSTIPTRAPIIPTRAPPIPTRAPSTPTPTRTAPAVGPTPHPPAPGGLVFSAYKDVTLSADWNTNSMRSLASGSLQPITQAMPGGMNVLSWAFATGECGIENWAGMQPDSLSKANVAAFVRAGKQYIISTGGVVDMFTCGSDAGFETFVNRYVSANLIGIDFDIECGQNQTVLDHLVARVKTAQGKWPKLRFSFTFATLAPTAGGNPLSLMGNSVMAAIQRGGLKNYYINLLTMDYGSVSPHNCIVVNGACEMGQSAIHAAKSFSAYWKVPYSQIELTPMNGPNYFSGETFTVEDAAAVGAFAKAVGLGGIHYWSFDRDNGLTFAHQFITSLEGHY